MAENFKRGRNIGFQNTFYTKCVNIIIDSIGPSIILKSIYRFYQLIKYGVILIIIEHTAATIFCFYFMFLSLTW